MTPDEIRAKVAEALPCFANHYSGCGDSHWLGCPVRMRPAIEALLTQAIAEAKAEQREADAAIADRSAKLCNAAVAETAKRFGGNSASELSKMEACEEEAEQIAKLIRLRDQP